MRTNGNARCSPIRVVRCEGEVGTVALSLPIMTRYPAECVASRRYESQCVTVVGFWVLSGNHPLPPGDLIDWLDSPRLRVSWSQRMSWKKGDCGPQNDRNWGGAGVNVLNGALDATAVLNTKFAIIEGSVQPSLKMTAQAGSDSSRRVERNWCEEPHLPK